MRGRGLTLAWAILAVALVSSMATPALAQSGRGTITGVVRDASGSLVPGAAVTATNRGTNAVTTVTTNADGLYSLRNLPIGTYSVNFTLSGFLPYTQEGIALGLGETITLDHTLTVGGLAEAVTVNADTALLNRSNPEIGTSMASDIVTNLPLNFAGGRSLENFAYAIAPSVEGNNWTSHINGGADFTKEVVLDGTSAVIQIGGHIGESSPSMEAVEEFTVQTSGIPAEYGRTAGGVFNFSLKSGTNQFRGSAYGYLRNEALNANTWQNNYLAATDPENADGLRARQGSAVPRRGEPGRADHQGQDLLLPGRRGVPADALPPRRPHPDRADRADAERRLRPAAQHRGRAARHRRRREPDLPRGDPRSRAPGSSSPATSSPGTASAARRSRSSTSTGRATCPRSTGSSTTRPSPTTTTPTSSSTRSASS